MGAEEITDHAVITTGIGLDAVYPVGELDGHPDGVAGRNCWAEIPDGDPDPVRTSFLRDSRLARCQHRLAAKEERDSVIWSRDYRRAGCFLEVVADERVILHDQNVTGCRRGGSQAQPVGAPSRRDLAARISDHLRISEASEQSRQDACAVGVVLYRYVQPDGQRCASSARP